MDAFVLFSMMAVVIHMMDLCVCLNNEGMVLLRFRERVELDPYGALGDWGDGGGESPCSWFGVGCSDGRVVDLNLRNRCLRGTLAPELGKLAQLKSLVLHNNSFYGVIPREIAELHKLEVLDLGFNNFSGLIPSFLSTMMSLEILILKSNGFVGGLSVELHQLNMISVLEVDENMLSTKRGCITRNVGNATIRKLMQADSKEKSVHHNNRHHRTRKDLLKASASPSPSPLPSHSNRKFPPSGSPFLSPFLPPQGFPSPAPNTVPAPSPLNDHPTLPPRKPPNLDISPPSTSPISPVVNLSPSTSAVTKATHGSLWVVYFSIAGGVSVLLVLSAVYFFYCNKVVTVRPWSTGLSGHLQKTFVTDGVPSLKRSELETSCEDFSNVIGSLSDCILYKGTLSSGVEIAVTSSLQTSAKDWSKDTQTLFRKKVSVLARVNHKNFLNLLGYCEEEKPFTRMMVFEYAPNGTLFEHLHIKEAEHLEWAARLRIAMGVAYCLEHLQQLEPAIVLRNLNSSSIYLTEDYAAKISDLEFHNHAEETESTPENSDPPIGPISDPKIVVYKFGIILLEILSGRRPFSQDDGLLAQWALSYFDGTRPVKDMIDPTLKSFCEKDLGALSLVVSSCIHPDPTKRPTMSEVTHQLRQITAVAPDAASPSSSPLWWAELEILSEAN